MTTRSKLIKENFNTVVDGLLTATRAQLQQYLPLSKLGSGGYINSAYRQSTKKNRFTIVGWPAGITAGVADGGTYARPLSPIDSFQLDTKIDDGKPTTGKVMASPTTPKPKASGVCITDESGSPYNISTLDYAAVPSCNLWLFW